MDEKTLVKQKLDIVDIVGGYIELKKSGRNYQALCPFHGENTPSFSVSPDLQLYKCFGCGETGDIFSFVQKIEGLDFRQTLVKLAEKAHVELKEYKPTGQSKVRQEIFEANKAAGKLYSYLLLEHKSGKPALTYLLKDRKFSMETIKAFGLGYAPDSWDTLLKFFQKKGTKTEVIQKADLVIKKSKGVGYIDKFKNRVLFPLVDINGQIVGFMGRVLEKDRKPKYLNSSETPVFRKGHFVFGLHNARVAAKTKGMVVVEGPTDVISAYQVGIRNVVAPLGTALTADQLQLISRYTKEIIFCFDDDAAGITAALRSIELAEQQDFNVRIAQIPDGFHDLDEYLKTNPKDAEAIFRDAVPVYDFFITSSLRKYDANSPYGKKSIMVDLVSRFAGVRSDVLLDHYVKKISKAVDLDEETVRSLISKKRKVEDMSVEPPLQHSESVSLEELVISLLLQANIDITRDFVYKLELKDFFDLTLRNIFEEFKKYVEQHAEKLEISDFIKSLQPPLQKACSDIFLKDYKVPLDDDKALVVELDSVLRRIKKQSAKRQIASLSKELKTAEDKKDIEQIQEITQTLQELSKYLV